MSGIDLSGIHAKAVEHKGLSVRVTQSFGIANANLVLDPIRVYAEMPLMQTDLDAEQLLDLSELFEMAAHELDRIAE